MRLPRRLQHGEPAELVTHLGELRARLVIALGAVVVGTIAAYAVHGELLAQLNTFLPEGSRKPVTLGVTEPFMTSLKISIAAGFALAMPVVLWQLWAFFAPAVQKGLQRAVAGLVTFGGLLFAAGIAFGYVVVVPAGVRFLTTYDADLYDVQVRATSYYSFVVMALLSIGLVFQLPVFMLGVVRLGVLTTAKLRRNRKIGYIVVAVVAVVLPGVDPVTTALTMLPLALLYEGSIWLSVLFERRWFPEREPLAEGV